MKSTRTHVILALIGLSLAAAPALAARGSADTKALVRTYETIADSILATKNSEDAIVRAILQVHADEALAALDRAAAKGGSPADLKAAASHIGDFATEGGAAVEPIRTRLLAGGHHHNADDTGPNAVYDEGYVVLTKKMKQEVLELAKRTAKAAEASSVDAKEAAAIREAFAAASSRDLASK